MAFQIYSKVILRICQYTGIHPKDVIRTGAQVWSMRPQLLLERLCVEHSHLYENEQMFKP